MFKEAETQYAILVLRKGICTVFLSEGGRAEKEEAAASGTPLRGRRTRHLIKPIEFGVEFIKKPPINN